MKRVKQWIILFIAAAGLCHAADSYLKKLAPVQKTAFELQEKARQPNGADGLKWRFATVDPKKNPELDLSGVDAPWLLFKAPGKSYSRVDFSLVGIKNGNEKILGRYRGNDHVLISPKKLKGRFDAIRLDARKTYDVWIGGEETLRKVWKDYLNSGRLIYADNWVPLMDEMEMSDEERFAELQLLRGKPFPATPQQAAKMYASGCKNISLKQEAENIRKSTKSWGDVEAVRKVYSRDRALSGLREKVEQVKPADMMEALVDLDGKFRDRGLLSTYEKPVSELDARKKKVLAKIDSAAPDAETAAPEFLSACRDLMLVNPLLDDLELLAVRRGIGYMNLRDHAASLNYPGRVTRRSEGASLGAPSLSTHSILKNIQTGNPDGWNSEIVKLSNLRGTVDVTPLYAAEDDQLLISNARLHWDGKRVAFTMGSYKTPMALFELDVETGKTKRLSPETQDHFIDACYLPDGHIIVMSTAIMTALACEGGSHLLSNMYLLSPETGTLRQLGLDQENSYHASVQEDGRVVYIRYEYTDNAHYFSRIMMNMNPDGTNQREIYGSNSVWPTAMFYPQKVPGESSLYSAVIAGHHGPSHMGRLVLFDVQKGRREADGAVQFIGDKEAPVDAVVVDRLYNDDYPKHMYSVPLDADYYLTMMKPGRYEAWGLYLVDRFDNKTLIVEPEDDFIAWPQVYREKPMPPVVPSRVREESKTSTIYVQDIYEGPGLEGIKRGSVKALGIYAFHYGYKSAASHAYIGIESAWDGRYLLGTVPVNEDGSVMFNVPSMLPISFLALDKDGMALQKMRTWMNPQPGEVLSCVGCHETADQAPVNRPTMAVQQRPAEITPWYGDARPYSFVMEVQPVLDQYCISCHNGTKQKLDLRNSFSDEEMLSSKGYSASYVALQKYVRRNGPESNPELMVPMEWHASSSKLIQMMAKGHHGVELDQEAWGRLTMWIDLNVPFHAAFHPASYGDYGSQIQWRVDSLKKYANLDWNPEEEYQTLIREFVQRDAVMPVTPKKQPKVNMPTLKGWPFAAKSGLKTQALEFGGAGREIKSYDWSRAVKKTLSGKERIEFVRIPAGQYVMGSATGYPNETPRVVKIDKPFWMSVAEISNSQMQTCDPSHDSKFADMPEKDQVQRGVPLYNETQPAVRVSHAKAVAFCEWLSKETGKKVTLPTEEQWEWAARAGTAGDTWYGDRTADFAKFANLSDKSHGTSYDFTRRKAPQYFLFDKRVNDGHAVSSPIKSYQPNAWGLYDMIGNAEEWTSTPGCEAGSFVVKGGSWFDVPKDATSSVRWAYHENIRLPDLGFRIIIEE